MMFIDWRVACIGSELLGVHVIQRCALLYKHPMRKRLHFYLIPLTNTANSSHLFLKSNMSESIQAQRLSRTYSKWIFPVSANATANLRQVGLLGGNIRCDTREPNQEHLMHREPCKLAIPQLGSAKFLLCGGNTNPNSVYSLISSHL